LVELATHYYLDNFLRLCDTVEDRYGDILSADEQLVLDCFRSLSFASRCLYVRLVSRTGPWFLEGKLNYPEIGPLTEALDELLETTMAEEALELGVEELGQLFTRAELQDAFIEHLGKRRCGSKDALLEAIETLELSTDELLETLAAVAPGRIVAPLHLEVIELLQLLFFGNRYQSLTEFVLEDLGITRYFPYPLERVRRKFENRDALDEYLQCAALADIHYELLELETPQDLPALARRVARFKVTHDSSTNRYHRLCNSLARDLERREELELALALYQRSERHPARERRARILEKRDAEKAKSLCQEIIEQPWCEAEQEAAARILPRVLRKLGDEPASRRRDAFDQRSLELPREKGPVELLVARHLQREWREIHFVENRLMNTLFGLAFWEEIFMPLPGAFHHAYQGGPSDMFEQGFRERRATAIERRMATLRRGNLASTLSRAYHRYHPYHCHWTDWRRVDAAMVETACQVIPRNHLLAVFERLLFDPRENRKGFPDLVALGNRPGDYCLIEVKGPGDALQEGQKGWLRYFADKDIPARVARVQWADD
jgi:hypothetical protein